MSRGALRFRMQEGRVQVVPAPATWPVGLEVAAWVTVLGLVGHLGAGRIAWAALGFVLAGLRLRGVTRALGRRSIFGAALWATGALHVVGLVWFVVGTLGVTWGNPRVTSAAEVVGGMVAVIGTVLPSSIPVLLLASYTGLVTGRRVPTWDGLPRWLGGG